MPRYLVTLRHAKTGETRTEAVWGDDVEDAYMCAEDSVNGEELFIMDPKADVWLAVHAAPADDEPVPFRDR